LTSRFWEERLTDPPPQIGTLAGATVSGADPSTASASPLGAPTTLIHTQPRPSVCGSKHSFLLFYDVSRAYQPDPRSSVRCVARRSRPGTPSSTIWSTNTDHANLPSGSRQSGRPKNSGSKS